MSRLNKNEACQNGQEAFSWIKAHWTKEINSSCTKFDTQLLDFCLQRVCIIILFTLKMSVSFTL